MEQKRGGEEILQELHPKCLSSLALPRGFHRRAGSWLLLWQSWEINKLTELQAGVREELRAEKGTLFSQSISLLISSDPFNRGLAKALNVEVDRLYVVESLEGHLSSEELTVTSCNMTFFLCQRNIFLYDFKYLPVNPVCRHSFVYLR